MGKFLNYVNNSSKKKDEEEKKSSNLSQIGNFGKYTIGKSIGLDTLETDLSSMGKTIEGIYNGWQTQETMNNTRTAVQSIYDRLGKYQDYQKKYGGTDLSELHNSYKSILNDWDNISKHYGKYKSADEYNNALKVAEKQAAEYESMKTADLKSTQKEIADLEGILETAKGYESNIQRLQNKQNTWEHRSRGLTTDRGYTSKVKEAEAEYNKYLESMGYGSAKELEKLIGEKKQYKNKAEWIQKGLKLASVGDEKSENYDKDFAEKSKYVQGKKSFISFVDTYEEIYDYINADEKKKQQMVANIESNADSHLLTVGYDYMTDKEVSTYNYYYNKFGKDKAKEYLNTIIEDLGNRKALADFERYEGKLGKELLFGVQAGLDQFMTGTKNLFNTSDEYIPVNATQQLSGLIREDIQYEHGNLGQIGYDLINTTSNMLPSILTSAAVSTVNPVVGANVGAGLMGASASGNAYQEMLNLGYDKGQARTYSKLVGISEAGLQRFMGGIGKLGGVSGKLSKVVSGIDNGLAKFAVRWGGSALAEGFEEAAQEVLNPLFINIAAGYDTGADVDWSEVVYSGLLGALSGGVLEGGGLAVNSYRKSSFNKAMGQNIKANERVSDLFDIASNPEVASAYDTYTRYANKGINADNISDAKLGNLYSLARADAVETSQSKKSTQEQKDFADKIVSDLDTYAQQNPSARVSKKDIRKYDAEMVDGLIAEGLESAENTQSNHLATEYKTKLESGKKLSTDEISKLIEANEKAFRAEDSKSVTDRLAEIGESSDIANIVARKINGERITLDEAEKLNSNEHGLQVLAENIDEDLVGFIKTMDSGADANLFISLYDGKTDVEAYANAFNLATAYAKNNFTYDTILKNKGVLSTDQVKAIYGETRIKADKEAQNTINKLNEKMADTMTYKGFIKDSAITEEVWGKLDKRQQQAVTFIKGFAQASGMNLILKHNPDSKHGGAYEVNGNTITIDISKYEHATKGLMETIIPTMSHETTHWMEEKSPELWRNMNALVFSTLQEADGINEETRIQIEQARLKKKGRKGTVEEARSEIIARACEDMLSMSEQGKKMFNSLSESEQKTLVGKIKEIIQNLKNWVNELLGTYKSDSYEAKIMRQYEEKLNRLSKLWDEMLKKSVVANQLLEKSGAFEHDITSIGTRNLNELSDAVGTDGESLFQYRAMVEDEDIYREMLLKHKDTIGITDKQITELFATIDKAVDIISNNLEALDYAWDSDIDDRAFSPVKPNSDTLYKVSLDFSTLCRKRLLQQTIQSTLQQALNKNLSKEESIAIRDELIKIQEEGRKIEVACALCYVESARMKSPKQINKFLNNRENIIREFFANKSGGSIKEKIANAELKARKKLQKDNPNGLVGKNGVILDALTAPKSKMTKADADYIRAEGKKVKESYKLTEYEQAELDVAKKMSADDFTSAKGLENLAKEHPDLFDIYTSFVRNATHSKGIENDTWWRAGDSNAIGDTLIAQMNAENGLRSQSWSDFQVIHLLDYVAATIELSTKGAKRQSYTKVPDYVKLLGNTGDMINMSLIPERVFDGKLSYDGVEGMAYDIAKQLRDEYHETVGTICIGIENEQIRLLLEDNTIDMVIPYHHSSMSKATRKLMHIPTWITYEKSQNESNLSDADAKANAEKYGVEIKKDKMYQKSPKFSEWFNLEEARQIAKLENEHPSDMDAYKKYGKMYGGYMAMQNAANNYLKLCAERGLSPKFSSKDADFTKDANYWKLLTDRKMVDNVTGEIIEQKPIKPIFNEKHILEILNDELARYPQVKADQEYAQRKVVEKFLSGEMNVDQSTLDAIKKPIDNVTEVNILESSRDGILNSDREVIDIPFDMYSTMEKHFGTTKNFDVAGYMLRDGKMLDFSGKHWGATDSDFRQVDHRDINEVLEDNHNGVQAMTSMISNGNIRLMPEVGGINLSKMPNGFQSPVLRDYINHFKGEVIVDIDEVGGDTIHSFEYSKGTSASKILSDLEGYFNRGEMPSRTKSSVAEFRYSDRDTEYLELAKNPEQNAERLRELVDEAAYHNNYIVASYHGTPNGGFTRFTGGSKTRNGAKAAGVYWFTDDYEHARVYKSYPQNYPQAENPMVYNVYLNIGEWADIGNGRVEAIDYSTNGAGLPSSDLKRVAKEIAFKTQWKHFGESERARTKKIADKLLAIGKEIYADFVWQITETKEFAELCKAEGLDSVVAWEEHRGFHEPKPRMVKTYGVFSSEQVKSADLVTYDDDGNIIPLSQRFNDANDDIRYSDRDYVAYDSTAILKESTVDLYLRDYASEGTPNYAQAYITYMSPRQFLQLTTKNAESQSNIEKQSKKLNLKEFEGATQFQPIQLKIDHKTGEVVGHEGRHRMVALANEDIYNVPVLLFDSSNKTSKENLNDFTLTGQFNEYRIAIVEEAIPLNYANRDLIIEKFGTQSSTQKVGERLGIRETLRYSDREETSVYDIMGEKERILEENEKFKAEIERLKERLKIERKVTHGNYFNENQLGTVAGHLRNIAKSTYSKEKLVDSLKDVYSFIAHSPELAWEDVFGRCYNIAEEMLQEAKPEKMVDDRYKIILKDVRNSKISLSESQKQEAQHIFGKNWNRNFLGKVIITDKGLSLDSKWQEWASMYPDIFDADINDADMVGQLYDNINSLRDASETIIEYDTVEQARWLAREIYNQYWNVSPIRTTADKYDKQIRLLNFEHRRIMTEFREKYNSRAKDKIAKQKLVDDMYYGRILREKDKEVAKQKLADDIHYGKLIHKLKIKKEQEVDKAKYTALAKLDKYKENAERKTRIQRITANALSLNEMLIKNSKDKHVPEILREPVAALLQAIDFSSKRLLEKGEPTQKDISLSKSLGKVKDMMVKATNAHDELVELYGHGLDEDIEKMVDSVDDIMRTVGDNEFVINRMTLTDLQTLDKVIKTIKYAVNKLNKFHTVNHARGIANLSQESVLYLDSLGKGKIYDGIRGKMKKLLDWGNALPYYVFKRYGSGGMKVYEALQDGWDKFAFNVKAILDYANETYTSKEVNEWSEEVKTFKITIPANESELENPDYVPKYQEVQLTVPQIMSMYCLNKREQARGHLFKGGIRVADFKDKKGKIVSQSDGIVFTEKDVRTIFDSLTERQKSVANKLQEFMNTVCADWGNDVSMARFGYKAFGEENYFPIQSDKNNLAVNDETEQPNSLFKLLNMSFTKSTIDKANNRIVISDIFDVFAQHTSDMAKYNALALPVLDSFKWYNYTEKEDVAEGTFKTKGVKQSIEKAFGKDGQNYFTTFLKDINGQQEVSRDTLGKGFFKNAKLAAVGMNLRVVLLQPTSYARASAVIDNKYLTKALVHKPKIKRAETHCGIALWKSMGYYDTNIQRGVEAQIKHSDTWKDKATDWSMKGAEIADKVTWGYLWNACELEVRDKQKDLKVGSKEFYDAIGKRLREVIYATQVVDSTMTRSQMMRSTDSMDKILTAFASEPTLSYNMLQDAYMELSLDARRMGKKEAWKKNGKRIARIMAAYTMTNVLAALIESGFDALRDDDDEEMDMIAFMKLYLKNFASDMSITGKIPYIKELHSMIQGFGSSRSDTQWMEEMTKAITTWYKVITTGKGKPSTAIRYGIKGISDLSGLPIYNVYRDTMATLNKLDLFTAEDLNEMFEDFFD